MREVARVEFDRLNRILIYLNIVIGVILLAYPMIYYPSIGHMALPTIALALPIANFILAIFAYYRFTLIEKYPYIISLPALTLVMYEGKLSPEERGLYINRMFGVALRIGVAIGLFSLILEHMIILDIVFGEAINVALFMGYSLVIPFVIMIWAFAQYAKIYGELKMKI